MEELHAIGKNAEQAFLENLAARQQQQNLMRKQEQEQEFSNQNTKEEQSDNMECGEEEGTQSLERESRQSLKRRELSEDGKNSDQHEQDTHRSKRFHNSREDKRKEGSQTTGIKEDSRQGKRGSTQQTPPSGSGQEMDSSDSYGESAAKGESERVSEEEGAKGVSTDEAEDRRMHMRNAESMTEEEIRQAEEDQRDCSEDWDNESSSEEDNMEEEIITLEQWKQEVEQLQWGRTVEREIRLAHHKHLRNLKHATQHDEYAKSFQWPNTYQSKASKDGKRKRKTQAEEEQESRAEQTTKEANQQQEGDEQKEKEDLQRQATILEAQAEEDQRESSEKEDSESSTGEEEEEEEEGQEDTDVEDWTRDRWIKEVEQLEWGRTIECEIRLAHHKHLRNLQLATQAGEDITSENRFELLRREGEINEFYASQYARKSCTIRNEICIQQEEYGRLFQWPKSYYNKERKGDSKKRKAQSAEEQGSSANGVNDSMDGAAMEEDQEKRESEEEEVQDLRRQAAILVVQVNLLKDENRELEDDTVNVQKIAKGRWKEIEAATRLKTKNGTRRRAVLPCRWNARHSDWEVAINQSLQLLTAPIEQCSGPDLQRLIGGEMPSRALLLREGEAEPMTIGEEGDEETTTDFGPLLQMGPGSELREGLIWMPWQVVETIPYGLLGGRFGAEWVARLTTVAVKMEAFVWKPEFFEKKVSEVATVLELTALDT
eukprot:GBG86754.1 hypothetical protein CBR_g42038 [Chara braunii]